VKSRQVVCAKEMNCQPKPARGRELCLLRDEGDRQRQLDATLALVLVDVPLINAKSRASTYQSCMAKQMQTDHSLDVEITGPSVDLEDSSTLPRGIPDQGNRHPSSSCERTTW